MGYRTAVLRKSLEEKEMNECTFRPMLNHNFADLRAQRKLSYGESSMGSLRLGSSLPTASSYGEETYSEVQYSYGEDNYSSRLLTPHDRYYDDYGPVTDTVDPDEFDSMTSAE